MSNMNAYVCICFSVKVRRQPVLAYSTRRKDFTGVNVSSSVLNTTQTPMSNKRKLTGNTPTNKYIKRELNTRVYR